jgi:2',3'-cyclic-nucleotide 2'-phosphodiesterase (5'-nucleotidase family)
VTRFRARLLAVGAAAMLLIGLAPATITATQPAPPGKVAKAVFFTSDGLRQDLVAKYAKDGLMPTMGGFLKNGTSAAHNGLRTQAPPNTGAGWYSLATGAWPAVHGSTNNTFHRMGQPFTGRTAAFDPNVLQAESIAQSAERGGLKVAQVEWAGGRNATIKGPTIDFQQFFSGRGVATNFIGKAGEPLFDDASFIQSFGLQFDHPAGYAGQAPYAGAAPAPAAGWSGTLPTTYSPAMEMHLRVLDFGTDKYGLDAWIFDSTNDSTTDYDRVLFSRTKNAADTVGILAKGQWADVKVKLTGLALVNGQPNPLEGKTAGFLVKVEELTGDLSRVRLFHTSVSRAQATWPTWPGESGFTGDFEEYLAQTFPTSTAADFAILEAGVTSEDTYVQQGLYWSTGHWPMLRYVVDTYKPDLLLAGMPTTDEFQHQFLGLVSPKLPNGQANPAYDDTDLNGVADGRVAARDGYIREAYKESDETLTLARSLMGSNVTTFVASDHGFAPQFLAIDGSRPLVDAGLLQFPQTSNCRPATAEGIFGKAKACWAGGALQIYLNVVGRDPDPRPADARSATLPDGSPNPKFIPDPRIPAADVAATVAALKTRYLGLTDPNDWTHDGQPESWKMIDRAYTQAEARFIPNGPNSTADMAHPTRTGDLVVFAYPPYQFDAETPGQLVAFSHFFGQHGYVPDVQDLAANVNMRATFLAGGQAIGKGSVDAATIDLAPTLAYLLRIPEPQHSQGIVQLGVLPNGPAPKRVNIIGLNDFHGQLDPTTLAFDGINANVGGAAFLASMFDEESKRLPGSELLVAAGDNVGASPPNSALLQDMPAIDVENAWGLDATSLGNHEFDYGVERLKQHIARAKFPFLATNVVETATGKIPSYLRRSKVFIVNGTPVGVIGAELQNTPELVSAGATAGLTFLPEAERIKAESIRLKRAGVRVQVVVIHQGTNDGVNPIGNAAGVPWVGPILGIADALQGTTVDAMVVGHTHRISNLMRGHILITEGINAGVSYSVLQLIISKGDVQWAGGATRVAKDIGVPARADVKAIVDKANADTAPLRNLVIGSQTADIKRDPNRITESAMGNLITDAMVEKYPEVDGAYTNSGGLRQDLVCTPPSATEGPCEITWGEMFAVLPFGNSTVILTLTGDQFRQAFLNGFQPACDPNFAGGTGRFPQISGFKVTYHCNGTTPVVDGMWKTPDGVAGPATPIGPSDTVRFVTNDFMYTGGDGYTIFKSGTDVKQTGDLLLDVAIAYVEAHSPVSAAPEGRITKGQSG